eukprot:2509911-Pleurochrysis_carterae.AAC.1
MRIRRPRNVHAHVPRAHANARALSPRRLRLPASQALTKRARAARTCCRVLPHASACACASRSLCMQRMFDECSDE